MASLNLTVIIIYCNGHGLVEEITALPTVINAVMGPGGFMSYHTYEQGMIQYQLLSGWP